MSDRVLMAAYGSNVNSRRLQAYLEGSSAESEFGEHKGSLDRAPIKERRALWLKGALRFGGVSRRWDGGGMAYVDLQRIDRSFYSVVYELSTQQFSDVFAQENARTPRRLDMGSLLATGLAKFESGFYNRIFRVGIGDHQTAFVFTHDELVEHNPPSPEYLSLIRRSLMGYLEVDEVDAYLDDALRAM